MLVIVMLIAFGLISLALYFANSMSLELRAAANRTAGLSADQAVEGAARYVSYVLINYATNGTVPDRSWYQADSVPVGSAQDASDNAHFWLIGRDTSGQNSSLSEPYFGLVDEASKLNLNAPWITADVLSSNFPNLSYDFAQAIIDWRDTNSTDSSLNYSQAGYMAKHAAFETVDELRLVYGASLETIFGDDVNRNGVLDPNENSSSGSSFSNPGLVDYFTVYSCQPNVRSDGTSLTNVSDRASLQALLELRLGSSRATQVINRVFPNPGGPGQTNAPAAQVSFPSLLDFYLRSGMTSDEFGLVYPDLTVTNAPYTVGRVNINTAPAAVLACLPGLNLDVAQQLVSYRQSNAGNLTSIAWIVDALGTGSTELAALAQGDYITTQSFQFQADIAATGPFGRGYRRNRFIFDISSGTPRVLFRQDLSGLGWALGRSARETWVTRTTQ